MNSLIEFWNRFDPKEGFIHKDDMAFFSTYLTKGQADGMFYSYSKRYASENPNTIRMDLLPQPYMGDIENSKIIIVMLNPGVGGKEVDEHNHPICRKAILDIIRQDFQGSLKESRYMYMNREFNCTDGYKYLCSKSKEPRKGRLRDCIEMIKGSFDGSIDDSIKFMSNNICMIEVFPYHSKEFEGDYELMKDLPSLKAANQFLNDKAQDPSNTIFIVRGKKALRFDKAPKATIFEFTDGEGRGAYFTKSKHGKELYECLERFLPK